MQDSVYRALREGRPADDPERAAYVHAAAHAETPVISMVDARGLACATRAIGDATVATVTARSVVDATGQVAALIDGRGLEAFTYARDLRGRVLAQRSVDAGSTWALADAYNRAVWTWDARGFAVERRFDHADRPVAVHVRGGDGATALDAVVESYHYGDELADRAGAIAANALGRAVLVRDEAGQLEVSTYDPLGSVRTRTRRMRALLDDAPDWRGDIAVEAEAFTTATRTDALGRMVWTQLADGTIRREAFHPGGALATVQLTTPDGTLVDAPIVSGLARDAHGRIAAATLGNGCVQAWRYDVESGQLAAQDAVHDGRALQALRYTYDPDGKLVRALDLAQEGPSALVPAAVSAGRDYRYDAHGRLLEATGRVHQALLPHDGPATAGCIHGARHISLDNGAALERYTQRFHWDHAGNLARVQHIGATASWATDYWISPTSNRASPALDDNGNPIIAPETLYDAGGNLTQLWHLRALGHSWRACLTHAVTVARAAGPVDDGERYTYAADRVRVRKVATRLVVGGDAPVIETREVVYLDGGQERVRVRRGDQLVLERFTTHVSDGDRRVAVIDRHAVDTLGHEVIAIGPARVRYHLTTAQGSTALELDEAARLISYEEYLPHGGSAFIAGDSVREVARRDIRYTGKERDRATGLHAYPQRYYAPWLGRWLTPDPLGPEDGLNLYAFVGGDPIGYVDPEGTDRKQAGLRQVATEDPEFYYVVDESGWAVAAQIYDHDAEAWETVPMGERIYLDSTAPPDPDAPQTSDPSSLGDIFDRFTHAEVTQGVNDDGIAWNFKNWPEQGTYELTIEADGDTYRIRRDESGALTHDVNMVWPASGERRWFTPSSAAIWEDMLQGSVRWQLNPEMVADYHRRMNQAAVMGALRGASGGAPGGFGGATSRAALWTERALLGAGAIASGANAYESFREGNYGLGVLHALTAGLMAYGVRSSFRSPTVPITDPVDGYTAPTLPPAKPLTPAAPPPRTAGSVAAQRNPLGSSVEPPVTQAAALGDEAIPLAAPGGARRGTPPETPHAPVGNRSPGTSTDATALKQADALAPPNDGLYGGARDSVEKILDGAGVKLRAYDPPGRLIAQSTDHTCVATSCRMIASVREQAA